MALSAIIESDDDAVFTRDAQNRYLGHTSAKYGFVLHTLASAPLGDVVMLSLNPQGLDQDEEGAVVITPTQNGGKFIENQGNIFKDISITGTTGFLPVKNFSGAGGLVALSVLNTGAASTPFGHDALSDYTGYAAFMALRSLFREYWQTHRTGTKEERDACKLYWVNQKDDESWLVEPLFFRMQRSSRSPMTYNYSIRLRTLSRAITVIPPDPASVITGIQALVTQVKNSIDAAQNLVRNSLGFFQQYRSLRSQILSILDVGTEISGQLTNVASGVADVLDLPRSLIASTTANVMNVFQGFENAADIIEQVPVDTLEGLTTLRQQFDFVLSRPELFVESWSATWNRAIQRFNTAYGTNGNVTASLANPGLRTGLVEATCMSEETIYQFALRVTGDATRAMDIIVLNKLKWPYFSPSPDQRLPATVAPGDPILVPVFGTPPPNNNLIRSSVTTLVRSYRDDVASATSLTLTKVGVKPWTSGQWVGFTVTILTGTGAGQSQLITGNDGFTLTVPVAWSTIPDTTSTFGVAFQSLVTPKRPGIVELLGVDLRIARTDVLSDKWDLVLDSNGDLSTVRGTDNLNQALTVKMMTKPGDLILHPWFGLSPSMGEPGTLESLFRMQLYARQTLLSDSRVEAVVELFISQVKDQYQLTAKLAVKGGLRSQYTSPLP